MPRSGTTLLDKLLSLHPCAQVLSQPLPLIYIRLKRIFLEARCHPTALDPAQARYPLNGMLGAHYYPPADFLAFLETFTLSRTFCRRCLEDMRPLSGQYTKPRSPLRIFETFQAGTLYDFVSQYCASLVSPDQLPDELAVVGSKETYCEEYTPYLLANGAKVLYILRDPRDVLTSLSYGNSARFGGRPTPHLFNIRQWRKSVAFALAHKTKANFLAVRYEDLVCTPRKVLNRITCFLALDEFPPETLERDLRSQSGDIWQSNSSFDATTRISSQSVGRYRRYLPQATGRLVQALCFREMQHLGYTVDIKEEDVLPIIDCYVEIEPLARPELDFYMWSPMRREGERKRWQRLCEGTFEPTLFIFETAFSQLQKRLGATSGKALL